MAWNDTQQGVDLNNAFGQLLYCYQHALPSHLQSIKNLAQRPITG
jgi:hypothetical protein